jgi:branched-chain amino acid transport system substrate-binding protein
VRARWLCLAAVVFVGLLLAGCGGVGISSGASSALGKQLAIYSSLPLQGPSAGVSEEIVGGEKLALSDAGGRVGEFKISYVSLDDANPKSGQWDPGVTATDAKTAAQDTGTIAYLGEYGSAATAISLPLINAAGIAQVSPESPYVGLTSALDAGQDEPERFYPSGKRNFARLQPGDSAQAETQVELLRTLGVKRIYVLNDQNPFEIPLSQILAGDAEHAGIRVAGSDSLSTTPGAVFTGEVEKIVESRAQAVFFAGGPGTGMAALWKQLHSADPRLWLLGSSSLAVEEFTSKLGTAASIAYLTTPLLPLSFYPPSAQRVLSDYRRRFATVGGPYVLYGYEAMAVVLDAIRAAGSRGNSRQAVIEKLLATKGRDSVIGRYSIEADGETTLSSYGVDRVASDGRPVFYRVFHVR